MTAGLDVGPSMNFTGSKPYNMIPLYLNAANICISLRSTSEVVSRSLMKILEYMACGRPVVSTRVSEANQLIIPKAASGLLASPEDPSEVVDAIVQLLTNPHEAEAMDQRGRQFVMESYTWMHTAKGDLAVLDDVVQLDSRV